MIKTYNKYNLSIFWSGEFEIHVDNYDLEFHVFMVYITNEI